MITCRIFFCLNKTLLALIELNSFTSFFVQAREVICCPRRAQFIDNANILTIDSKVRPLVKYAAVSEYCRV